MSVCLETRWLGQKTWSQVYLPDRICTSLDTCWQQLSGSELLVYGGERRGRRQTDRQKDRKQIEEGVRERERAGTVGDEEIYDIVPGRLSEPKSSFISGCAFKISFLRRA